MKQYSNNGSSHYRDMNRVKEMSYLQIKSKKWEPLSTCLAYTWLISIDLKQNLSVF